MVRHRGKVTEVDEGRRSPPPPWVAHALGAVGAAILVAVVTLLVVTFDMPWDEWGVRGGTIPSQLAALVIGWILAVRRAENPIGWLLLVIATILGVNSIKVYLDVLAEHDGWSASGILPALGEAAWVPGIVLLLYVFAVFPDGRPPPGRRGRFLVGLAVLAVLVVGTAVGATSWTMGATNADAPDAGGALFLPMPLFVATVVTNTVINYRRARGVRRQQMRWVACAFVPYALTVAALPLTSANEVALAVDAVLGTLLVSLMMVAMGRAILRYRLYDLDRIVSRTLAYVALSGLLAMVWAAVAIVPTLALGGGADVSNVVIAGATLAALAVAQPLRRRVQDAIDRRLYRSRYDAHRAVERLGMQLSDEVDMAALEERVLGTLTRTLRPRTVAVWTPGLTAGDRHG